MPYVPILKVKQGEMTGLENLVSQNDPNLDFCLPLLEINPCLMDVDTDIPKDSVDTHLEKALKLISRKWGNRRFLLDFKYTLPFLSQLQELLDIIPIMQKGGLAVTPVFKASSSGYDFQAAIAINKAIGNGIAIRYYISDENDFTFDLANFLQQSKIPPQSIDLIFDFEANIPEGATASAMQMWAEQNMNSLLVLGGWRTITIAASSFPNDFTGFGTGSLTFLPRSDWMFWKMLHGHQISINQKIFGYGDYGPLPLEPMYYYNIPMQPAAKIRYAIEDNWIFLKGLVFSTHGGAQFRQMSANIIARPEFRSRVNSWGDQFIDLCANQSGSTGNLTTWVSVGVNRHVAFCLNQLASLNAL